MVNYLFNRRLPTAQNRGIGGTIWKYYCLWAVQLVASISGTTLLCEFAGMGEMLAKLLTDLILALASYQVQLRWVFAKGKTGPRTKPRTNPPLESGKESFLLCLNRRVGTASDAC